MQKKDRILLPCFVLLLLIPAIARAHQPRLVTQSETIVTEPAVSKAYYGQLTGKEHVFHIDSPTSFELYVSILVPDINNQKKDVSVTIVKDGDTRNPVTELKAQDYNWTQMWEEFGQSMYWQGPEYITKATAGKYDIRVHSPDNDSRYSLAIGEAEDWNMTEMINALMIIPGLKQNFFNESPANFILSPFGWGYIVLMYILAFAAGLIYRFILRKVAAKKSPRALHKNIGTIDRAIRAGLGVTLLILAICTTWNPILLFFSGFCIFEAIFSWCGLYAAMGKNTCPLN